MATSGHGHLIVGSSLRIRHHIKIYRLIIDLELLSLLLNLFFLLKEIVAALQAGCNIIPIIDNFQWPDPEELPEDMRAICSFNGVR